MRRPARPDDLAAVHAVFMARTVNPWLGYEPMTPAEFRPIFEAFVRSGRFFVFEEKGRIAGFYRATRFDGRGAHVAELGALAVDPDAQGTGVAQRMLTDAIAMLKAEGVTRIELRVDADNPRARAFYEKMGFATEGVARRAFKRRDDAEPIDDLMMALVFG